MAVRGAQTVIDRNPESFVEADSCILQAKATNVRDPASSHQDAVHPEFGEFAVGGFGSDDRLVPVRYHSRGSG